MDFKPILKAALAGAAVAGFTALLSTNEKASKAVKTLGEVSEKAVAMTRMLPVPQEQKTVSPPFSPIAAFYENERLDMMHRHEERMAEIENGKKKG